MGDFLKEAYDKATIKDVKKVIENFEYMLNEYWALNDNLVKLGYIDAICQTMQILIDQTGEYENKGEKND